VSARTVFRNGVKHWLIKSFKWDPNKAWIYVYNDVNGLDNLRHRGLSPYKAAAVIDKGLDVKEPTHDMTTCADENTCDLHRREL
jgi:hypothetical protein